MVVSSFQNPSSKTFRTSDAFGRPVDHGGGGRHLERAEQIEALREQQKKLRH